MKLSRLLQVTAAVVVLFAMPLAAAISIPTATPSVQPFDGIGTAATAALPADFRVDRPTGVRSVGSFGAAASATTLAGGANLSSSASNGIYKLRVGTTTTDPTGRSDSSPQAAVRRVEISTPARPWTAAEISPD